MLGIILNTVISITWKSCWFLYRITSNPFTSLITAATPWPKTPSSVHGWVLPSELPTCTISLFQGEAHGPPLLKTIQYWPLHLAFFIKHNLRLLIMAYKALPHLHPGPLESFSEHHLRCPFCSVSPITVTLHKDDLSHSSGLSICHFLQHPSLYQWTFSFPSLNCPILCKNLCIDLLVYSLSPLLDWKL